MQDDMDYGLELMSNLEYQEAINVLTAYINFSKPNKDAIAICQYNIGVAYYSLKKYEKAIEYLSKEYHLETYQRNARATFGICKIAIGDVEEGREVLKKIIEERKDDPAFRKAVFSLVPLIVSDDKLLALKLYDELYESTFKSEDDANNEDFNKLRTISQYYKAEIYFSEKNNVETLESLKKSLMHANTLDSLDINFSIYNLSKEKNKNVVFNIIDTIIEQELRFDLKHSYPISFCENHLYNYLSSSFDLLNLNQFERLLNYSYDKLFEQKIDKYQIVYSVRKFSTRNEELLKYILSNESNVSDSTLIQVYRDLAFLYPHNNSTFFAYFNKYQQLFLKIDNVNNTDIYLYALAIKNRFDENKFKDGLILCRTIDNRIVNLEDEELKFESIVIYYWYSNLSHRLNKREDAVRYAEKTIHLANDSKKESTSMIDEEGIKSIVTQMNDLKQVTETRTPMVKEKKYGRNQKVKVRCKDGSVKEGKYKKFEADILAKRCLII
jgi:tetratricopeptide (TPR) repeat protein